MQRRLFSIISLLLLLSAGLAAALYFQLLADLPPVSQISTRQIRPSSRILDRNGRLLYEIIDPDAGKQINLSLDRLPPTCVQATIATEDSRFFLHPGVDPLAILRAMLQNLRAGGNVVSGASTLTQQLARSLLLDADERFEPTIRRKVREAWLAWQLERYYTKDELLALYLNQTYYGNFAFGIEAASEIFFAKPATQLSRGECALLAGLIQYPVGYNPLQYPDIAKARQLTVLRLLGDAGYINRADADQIGAEPLRFRSQLFEINAPHFVMNVQALVAKQIGIDRLRDGGLQIRTTLDLNLQEEAERAVQYRLDLLNCRRPGICSDQTDPNRRIDNAAAVILDAQSGEILAMVGSPDYFDAAIQGNVNGALALRQPGSAIKPFTYAAAMDPGWSRRANIRPLTAADILADLPATFAALDEEGNQVPYVPLNYDRAYHGPVSVRSALANSYNIPAVKVLERIGVDRLQRLASDAGISSFDGDYGLALTLGGAEVTLLDLSAAYGIFIDGRRLAPASILEISDGETPISSFTADTTDRQRVIQPATAYLISDILSDKIARIPAFGEGSVLELPFPAAVKTGTTTDWRDNWTVGYSSRRIAGVWVGNADNAPMHDVSGIDGAGPIWRDLMLAAHPGHPPPIVQPTDITEQPICAASGLLPSEHCGATRQELFLSGTEPTRVDDQFQLLAVAGRSGHEALAGQTQEQVYRILPPEYHDWMNARGIDIAPTAGSPSSTAREQSDNPTNMQQVALHVTAPAVNGSYMIHPGLPAARQRIEIIGLANGAEQWAELRLLVDDEVIAHNSKVNRLHAWWDLEVGSHTFRLQGRPPGSDDWTESAPTAIRVAEFQALNNLRSLAFP